MQKLTNPEITEIEKSLGLTLPGLYRKLLVEIGFGSFGQKSDSKCNTTREVYHPGEVRDLSSSFFTDPSALFHPYFPFGCDNDQQEWWIIDSVTERAASIWHETNPEDWAEEQWLEYDEWVVKFLGDEAEF
jgi:hypothetical protein